MRVPLFVTGLLTVFTVLSVAAILFDFFMLPVVTKGVTMAGHDLSGMTQEQVRAAIETHIAAPSLTPLAVMGTSGSWSLDPRGIIGVNADAMVEEAYAPARNATILTRLVARVASVPLPGDVKPEYTVATPTLAAWVDSVAATVDTQPVDATRTVVGYHLEIRPERYGATVDKPKAVEVLTEALTGETALADTAHVASLPIELVAPKVLSSSFKRAIVVSISQCKVRLYDGAALIKTYMCAPGQPAWPTPRGDFVIVRKQANAPWINPGSAWAVKMPHMIPGGPDNPMGDRKIAINYPGVFLHGIPPSEYGSIGTHASHGCMRMMPSAIHDLFPRVQIGDPVYIRS